MEGHCLRKGIVMYVYLLDSLSAPGERYVGLTADLHRRLDEHEAYLESGSGHAFAKRRFW
ncbi:MAG: hypothetical protein WBF17_08975 [Phycisphaerae bacterium]